MNIKINLPIVLTILFVALKLFDVIAWSWWLVFMPLIVGAGITIVIVIGGGIGFIAWIRKQDNKDPDGEW